MSAMQSFVDRLDHPVYVVTVAADEERAGCLVTFASPCSIKPARFMVWLSTLNRTYRVARSAEQLAVHLLGCDQHALAELFGGETGDRVDKFARTAWTPGPGGLPVLDGTLAWFAGRVEAHVDTGDHIGFLLSSVAGETQEPTDRRPLCLSDVVDITAGHPVS